MEQYITIPQSNYLQRMVLSLARDFAYLSFDVVKMGTNQVPEVSRCVVPARIIGFIVIGACSTMVKESIVTHTRPKLVIGLVFMSMMWLAYPWHVR